MCRSIPGRPKAPSLSERTRIVEPGSYRRLRSDGTADAGFEVLPIESYLVPRSLIVDIGAYYGDQSDAWDAIEACERALKLPNAPPEPDLHITAHSFRQPDAAECETDGSGECADVPQGSSPVTP